MTIALREQRVIPTNANIDAGVNLGAPLANEDVSRNHLLAAKHLDAQSLGLGIATVLATSACFFMCHFGIPVCWCPA